MGTPHPAPPALLLVTAFLAALSGCGDDSETSSGDGSETSDPTSGPTNGSTTHADPTTESPPADGSSSESSESGSMEVQPGDVIESESFYEIGADASISDLASSPAGDVYVVLDAYFQDASGWQLHRLGGGLWPAPRAGVLAFEPDGSILCGGRLTSSTDFGGGRVTSAGDSDLVVVKRAPDGAHLYTRVFGDADGQYAADLGVDGDGNAVVGGIFRGTLDLGVGAFTSAEHDRIVLRLDPQGEVIDAVQLEDANTDTQLEVAGTPDGYVVAARAGEGLDIGGTVLASVEAGTSDIAVAGFDLAGALAWTYVLAVPGDEVLEELVVGPTGEVLILLGAASEVDLGMGPTAPAGAVLLRLDAGGAPLGVVAVDASVDADVAVNASGELALAGSFSGYVAERWDADGTSAWRTELNGAHGLLVAFDGDGNVVAAGMRQNMDQSFDVVVTTLAH